MLVIHPALARLRPTALPTRSTPVRGAALAAGSLVALATVLLRSSGALAGPSALVVLVVLVLAVPTSRELPRRILLLVGVASVVVPAPKLTE